MGRIQDKTIFNSLNDVQYFHNYNWLCHLATFIILGMKKGGQVTKPIILLKICYKLLYMSFKELKIVLGK